MASTTIEREPVPVSVIRPRRGFAPIPVRELIQFRDLLLTLAQRDVKLRYRQTALGAIWVVLQPLIGAGIFSFVFGNVAKLPSDGKPYFLFSFAGLLGWNAFANTLGKSSGSLVGNGHLVSKIYFPRLILPLSTGFGVVIDFLVALAMMLVLLVMFQVPLTLAILALPVFLALALMLAMGLGMYFASLMVTYRDVQYIVPVLSQFLMYGSPVAYATSVVPERFQILYALNPLVGILDGFRWAAIGAPITDWRHVGYSAIMAVVVFVGGALAFQKMERRFADVI